jgi:hypothetical protein
MNEEVAGKTKRCMKDRGVPLSMNNNILIMVLESNRNNPLDDVNVDPLDAVDL